MKTEKEIRRLYADCKSARSGRVERGSEPVGCPIEGYCAECTLYYTLAWVLGDKVDWGLEQWLE